MKAQEIKVSLVGNGPVFEWGPKVLVALDTLTISCLVCYCRLLKARKPLEWLVLIASEKSYGND